MEEDRALGRELVKGTSRACMRLVEGVVEGLAGMHNVSSSEMRGDSDLVCFSLSLSL